MGFKSKRKNIETVVVEGNPTSQRGKRLMPVDQAGKRCFYNEGGKCVSSSDDRNCTLLSGWCIAGSPLIDSDTEREK